MVHCCKEVFFELFWNQQMQKIVRHLLHDLSNYLTGNLALSELYCTKELEVSSEKFAIIKDNCYKEREILKQLAQLRHTRPGNVNYIDLQTFIKDLQPLLTRLLPAHTKFIFNSETTTETLIKFDVTFLQRIVLLTILLVGEAFENVSEPNLSIYVVREEDHIFCNIKSNVFLGLKTETLTKIETNDITLSQIYEPMVHFYLKKHGGSFSYTTTPTESSCITLTFPIVK